MRIYIYIYANFSVLISQDLGIFQHFNSSDFFSLPWVSLELKILNIYQILAYIVMKTLAAVSMVYILIYMKSRSNRQHIT